MEGVVLDLTVDPPVVIPSAPVVSTPPVVSKPVVSRICTSCNGKCRSKSDVCFMCRCLKRSTPEVAEYIRELYKGPCSICNRTSSSYHYDHINMFDKKGTILELVSEPIDIIKEEVAKCQIVCIPCHKRITFIERKLGYIGEKTKLTRDIIKGRDVEQRRKELVARYEAEFTPIYAELRAAAREIRGLPKVGTLGGKSDVIK